MDEPLKKEEEEEENVLSESHDELLRKISSLMGYNDMQRIRTFYDLAQHLNLKVVIPHDARCKKCERPRLPHGQLCGECEVVAMQAYSDAPSSMEVELRKAVYNVWEDDAVQFPRLIMEIKASLSSSVFHTLERDLGVSMNVGVDAIRLLFKRAEEAFDLYQSEAMREP